MSPASTSAKGRRRSSARKNKNKGALLVWWPLLLGFAVTPFAIHFASILALEGPSALRLLYPYVLLIKDPVLELPSDMGIALSQGMMYAQFPIYGLLMALVLRARGIGLAFGAAAVVHAAGIFVLFLTAHAGILDL